MTSTLPDGVRDVRRTRAYAFGRITTTYNPRDVFTKLQLEENGGLTLVDPKSPEKSALHIVLSDELGDVVYKFVCDMFAHENDRETDDGCLCALAESLVVRQIQPCTVRRIGGHAGQPPNYGLVAGGRRLAARALLVAISRLVNAKFPDNEDGTPVPSFGPDQFPKAARPLVELVAKHGPLADEIEATLVECTVLEAFDLAVRENKQRKPFNPVEDGKIYTDYLQMIDPATITEECPEGKKFNIKSLAKHLGEEYQHVRGRHALYNFYPADKHQKVVDKRINLTHAITEALALKRGGAVEGDGVKSKTRKNMLSRPKVEAMFDDHRDEPAALMVLSQVLQLEFDQAIEASDERIKDREAA
tara:strand:- start:1441 stop:2520 length:1080 start_codon:yes stop_codon:yes gene_type:complete